jgi:hypothetical protein
VLVDHTAWASSAEDPPLTSDLDPPGHPPSTGPIAATDVPARHARLTLVRIHERKLYRVGPNRETWPNTLTKNLC